MFLAPAHLLLATSRQARSASALRRDEVVLRRSTGDCVRRTTPSHWARCARELSGVARGTQNCRSFSTRPRTGHRVEWRGFADVLRGLGSRPAAACSTPRPRRKTSDASGGEEAGKVNAVLCGLRTSVFFVIREATVGIGCRSLFGLFNQRVLPPFPALPLLQALLGILFRPFLGSPLYETSESIQAFPGNYQKQHCH